MTERDGRDSAKCRKSKLGDIDVIIEFVLNDNKRKLCIVLSSPNLKETKIRAEGEGQTVGAEFVIFLEREHLLSKIPGDPTVEILRDKKQSGSTQR